MRRHVFEYIAHVCRTGLSPTAVPDGHSIGGSAALKYTVLEAAVLDELVEVWQALAGTRIDDECDGEEEDDSDESDLRGWLQELLLASAESDSLRELAREGGPSEKSDCCLIYWVK